MRSRPCFVCAIPATARIPAHPAPDGFEAGARGGCSLGTAHRGFIGFLGFWAALLLPMWVQAAGGEPEISIEQPAGTPLSGRVIAWGFNANGQTNVPAGLGGVNAISAGAYHSVALKADGGVIGWGLNLGGQATAPAGLSNVIALAAGGYHTLALKADGTVVAWGQNDFGQTNVPAGLTNVMAIAAGWYHTLALKRDGGVLAWGRSSEGQASVPAGLTDVIALAAGGIHSLALRRDGTVVGWGDGRFGQLAIPAGLVGVKAISVGLYHNLALKNDGSVVAWGINAAGQTNTPTGLGGVTMIAAGWSHSLALKADGGVVAWGENFSGQLNAPAGQVGVAAIAGGGFHSLALVGSSIGFASQELDSSSPGRTFLVKNTGAGPLSLRSVGVTGGDAVDFVVSTNGLLSSLPATNGETAFTVTFTPHTAGPRRTTLRVISNDSDEGITDIVLTGTGTVLLVPAITVRGNGVSLVNGDVTPSVADQTDFGSVSVASGTVVRTFTIENSGTAELRLGGVAVTGPLEEDFKVLKQPTSTVPAAGHTTFQVSFDPTALGLRRATLSFTNNDAARSPFAFDIQGNGSGSSNADLANLALSAGDLTPAFESAATQYTANFTAETSAVVVTATTVDATAGLEVRVNGGAFVQLSPGQPSGALALVMGANTVEVRVSAEDGTTTRTYIITLNRALPVPGELAPWDAQIAGTFVLTTVIQPDGKLIIGGGFTSVLGVPRSNIARLNADGTLDLGFDPKANDLVMSVAVQPDGKVLLGGAFTTLQPNGASSATSRRRAARLNADGTLDAAFDPRADSLVRSVTVQPDGKILLGGHFTTLQPRGVGAAVARRSIARVNADGTLEAGFDPRANENVLSLGLQPDGKVLVAGQFTTLQPNGAATPTDRAYIARLNPDGTLDGGFDPSANNSVFNVALQPDGRVLLGGVFTTLQPNGADLPTDRNYIARVNADGSLDPGYAPRVNDTVYSVAVQADGRVLLGGVFTTVQPNGADVATGRRHLARLAADGSLDAGFDPSLNDTVFSVAVRADGQVVAGGTFSSAQPNGAPDSTPRNKLAMILNDPATQTLSVPDAARVLWTRGGAAPEVSGVTFELSTNGGTTWTNLGVGVRASGAWQRTGLVLPASGSIRARGRTGAGLHNGSSGLIEQVATFRLQANAGVRGQIQQDGDRFLLKFTGVSGQQYRVQYTTVLGALSVWNEFNPAAIYSAPDGGVFTHADVNPASPLRFYRAVRHP